jgi:dsRNA-specific ribonuclease
VCEYVDYRPVYLFHKDSVLGLLKAEVILPNCLDPTVRQAFGTQHWHSEKQAKKDAAFEAYTALYRAGLVNDNLLPTPRCHQSLEISQDRGPSSLMLSESVNPWARMARTWNTFPNASIYPTFIKIERPSKPSLQMILILPERLPIISSCKLLRTSTRTYTASFENISRPYFSVDGDFIATVREINYTILRSIHSAKMLQNRTDIVTVFAPSLDLAELVEWKLANLGTESAVEAQRRFCPPARIVRNLSLWNSPQFFERWLDLEALEVVSPPRRRNFLGLENASSVRRSELCNKEPAAKIRSMAIENTTFDKLSPADAEFSLLVPSLMRHIEKYYVAGQLATSVLSNVQFHNLSVIVEALSASSACDTNNYQRLEHIGDVILKFIIVSQLFAVHHNWHEGYLSQAKDTFVANRRLAQAAIRNGLDQYILSRPFAPRKWIPPYIPELLEPQPLQKRSLSKKVLADVVEALIGAAYVDGGLPRAAKCVRAFLPEVLTDTRQDMFLNSNRPDQAVPYEQQSFSDLQRLLDFQFHRLGFLVEAMTHPSLTFDLSTSSYQRLEFLGDAVIDMLIVQRLASYTPPLTHDRMHLIKSALTNANFQAFLCMEFSLEQEISDVSEDRVGGGVFKIRSARRIALCDFMRYHNAEITKARDACVKRYQELASQIKVAIDCGKWYPWSLLARLEAPKYLADILESVFAAVLVDSQGDLATCEKLAERVGLSSYLSQMLREDIDLRHPKNRLSDLAIGKGKANYRIRKVDAPCEEFRCLISVGDREFEEIIGGTSREEVSVRAAEAAAIALSTFDERERHDKL